MILAIDPGNTSGVCIFNNPKEYKTYTIKENLPEIYNTIKETNPDVVVFERFTLYPAQAKHMIYNEFYTSQVIGVIKLACEHFEIPYEVHSAVNKDYVEYNDLDFKTEHEKDAYGHAWYFYYTKIR